MKTPTLTSRGRKVLLAGVSALSLIVAVQMPVPGLDTFNGAAVAATTTTP